MATTLTSKVQLILSALYQNPAIGIAVGQGNIDRSQVINLANGTGADQADRVFSETRTLAASGTYDLDLAGVLTDVFGVALTFARIKAIILFALAANTNNVVLGNSGVNAFLGPFGAAAHTVNVMPGGMLVMVSPNATGWPVTAGTGDILKTTNSAGGTGVTYDIVLIGASA